MRCAICNSEDDTIQFDRKTHTFSDCRTCQAVIFDTLTSYDGDDELLEEVDDETGNLPVAFQGDP